MKKKISKGSTDRIVCKTCWQKKYVNEFVWWETKNWKERFKKLCRKCDNLLSQKWRDENREKSREINRQYYHSERWQLKAKMKRYLYRKRSDYKKSMDILRETWEWKKIQKEYTRNFIIFQVPETDFTLKEKLKILKLTEEKYKEILHYLAPSIT